MGGIGGMGGVGSVGGMGGVGGDIRHTLGAAGYRILRYNIQYCWEKVIV
jgi:hypothetical protein